jgi:hypothetical protein
MNFRVLIQALVTALIDSLLAESDRLQKEHNEKRAANNDLRRRMEIGKIEAVEIEDPELPARVEVYDREALENELLNMFTDFQKSLEDGSETQIPGIRIVRGTRSAEAGEAQDASAGAGEGKEPVKKPKPSKPAEKPETVNA